MSALAANVARPDDLNLLLFLHVLTAMILVGSLILAGTALAGAWREGSVGLTRLGYKTLLVAVLPSWLVTRVLAQILADKPDYKPFEDSAWIGIGYASTEFGLLLIIAATVATGVGSRKAAREGVPVGTSRRVAAVLVGILIVAYAITIWAMTAKPT